jgi:hypothetical protein
MLDLETLDITPSAVILTMGAIRFDPYNYNSEPAGPLYLRINVDEQTLLGRTVDESTLEWWSKQSAEAQDEAMGDEERVSIEEFTTQLNRYIVGAEHIYTHGTIFDITILENLYRMINKPIPWNYWQIRDSRTIFDLGDDSAKQNNTAKHNALADAYSQAKSVQQIFKDLGIKKKGY